MVGTAPALSQDEPSGEPACDSETFFGQTYAVCSVDPAEDQLRLFWKNGDGEPFRLFSKVAEAVGDEDGELVFAVNAGMYFSDFTPMGLFVADGQQLRHLNTREIAKEAGSVPNFYRAPNGVFFIGDDGAGILPTASYERNPPDAIAATQSGPMLVIEGDLHPDFIEGSSDMRRRTGIGVCANGQVKVAVSDGAVNFFDFALLFRDQLDCPNALFLDGGRGAGIYSPELGRNDMSWHGGFGPILGLVR